MNSFFSQMLFNIFFCTFIKKKSWKYEGYFFEALRHSPYLHISFCIHKTWMSNGSPRLHTGFLLHWIVRSPLTRLCWLITENHFVPYQVYIKHDQITHPNKRISYVFYCPPLSSQYICAVTVIPWFMKGDVFITLYLVDEAFLDLYLMNFFLIVLLMKHPIDLDNI